MKEVERAATDIAHTAMEDGLRDAVEDMYTKINSEETVSLKELKHKIWVTNEWVDLIVGKKNRVYDRSRFRLFVSESGKATLAQGREIDVDVRRNKKAARHVGGDLFD